MGEQTNAEVLISLDIDWAPDELIADSLDLLSAHGVRATLFMTHPTKVDVSGHELALHPHFTDADLHAPIARLLEVFPNAQGTRSHSLFFTYRLIDIYEDLRIRYQSNVLAYKHREMQPFQLSRRVAELPIYFMDNIHVALEPRTRFRHTDLGLEGSGLKIFDFHPIHIFLNTDTLDLYAAAKTHYHDPRQLTGLKNRKRPGIRDLFIALLGSVASKGKTSCALGAWLSTDFQWTY